MFNIFFIILNVLQLYHTIDLLPGIHSLSKNKIIVQNSGILNLMPDAMGITFYIEVKSTVAFSLDIFGTQWKCCEKLDHPEIACKHMNLIGGNRIIISPDESKNLTFFYPNLYTYNREGKCTFDIWYNPFVIGSPKRLTTTIKFDTTLKPKRQVTSAFLENEKIVISICDYKDEDSLNDCKPVDCSRKYNGHKNYYSHLQHKCVETPKCSRQVRHHYSDWDGNNQLIPRVVYSPEGNFCQKTEEIFEDEEIENLSKILSNLTEDFDNYEFDFLICHNGIKNILNGRCNCQKGWKSPWGNIRPTTILVHLCTENEVDDDDDTIKRLYKREFVHDLTPYFIRLNLLIIFIIIIFTCCLSAIFRCYYKRRTSNTNRCKNINQNLNSISKTRKRLKKKCLQRSDVDEWVQMSGYWSKNYNIKENFNSSSNTDNETSFSNIRALVYDGNLNVWYDPKCSLTSVHGLSKSAAAKKSKKLSEKRKREQKMLLKKKQMERNLRFKSSNYEGKVNEDLKNYKIPDEFCNKTVFTVHNTQMKGDKLNIKSSKNVFNQQKTSKKIKTERKSGLKAENKKDIIYTPTDKSFKLSAANTSKKYPLRNPSSDSETDESIFLIDNEYKHLLQKDMDPSNSNTLKNSSGMMSNDGSTSCLTKLDREKLFSFSYSLARLTSSHLPWSHSTLFYDDEGDIASMDLVNKTGMNMDDQKSETSSSS